MASYNQKHKYKPNGFNITKNTQRPKWFYISLMALNPLNIRTGVNQKNKPHWFYIYPKSFTPIPSYKSLQASALKRPNNQR